MDSRPASAAEPMSRRQTAGPLRTPLRDRPRRLRASSTDNLNNALGAIRVLGLELSEGELRPHLNTVLISIRERDRGAAEQVVISGILPILSLSLMDRGPLTPLTTKLVAELAKESVVREGFGDAGLVTALVSVLTSPDPEVLLHAARAVSRVSHDSPELQELLLRGGAVPRLVAVLLRVSDAEALQEWCLLGLCNLSGMAVAEEAGVAWERAASVRPGESVFRGVSPRGRGVTSPVTLVLVSQWGPGQYAVAIEVSQRCSSSCRSLLGIRETARWFPFSCSGSCSKLSKFSRRSVPRTKSLFHTFL